MLTLISRRRRNFLNFIDRIFDVLRRRLMFAFVYRLARLFLAIDSRRRGIDAHLLKLRRQIINVGGRYTARHRVRRGGVRRTVSAGSFVESWRSRSHHVVPDNLLLTCLSNFQLFNNAHYLAGDSRIPSADDDDYRGEKMKAADEPPELFERANFSALRPTLSLVSSSPHKA
uniref:Uncharacterized protein n=1 Tax=Romanomermis culicivorax TaxID=13658 RepID=A0A915IRZ9_ROMCU